MKLANPRHVVIAFTLPYFGAAFFIPAHTPFFEDLYFSSFDWAQALVIRVTLTGMAALSSFLLWLFYRLWMRHCSRGLATVIVVGLLLPAVIVEVPREWLRRERRRASILWARIKTESRPISMEDEELVSASGHPIGVRLRYQVHYPDGGELIAHIPSATLSTAPSPYVLGFGAGIRELHALNSTDCAITVDLFPDFMPTAIVFLGNAKGSDAFCFNWKAFATPGPWGNSSRAAVLDNPPQTFRIDLGTPRYSAPTRRTYRLRRFYEGAQQEGAKECS